jgi:hypothetical protein
VAIGTQNVHIRQSSTAIASGKSADSAQNAVAAGARPLRAARGRRVRAQGLQIFAIDTGGRFVDPAHLS